MEREMMTLAEVLHELNVIYHTQKIKDIHNVNKTILARTMVDNVKRIDRLFASLDYAFRIQYTADDVVK